MKRYIITVLYAFVAYCAWGQLNAPCFTIPIPENTPATYSLHHFTQDSTVIDLDNTLLYALAISGEVTLQSDNNSSVKVILIDNYGVHHLVYEVNSLLADTNCFTIENVGRETLWDNPIYASQLLVRLNNASLTLNAITPVTELLPGSAPQQRALRTQEQNDTIVAVLNRNLIARDIPWRAGTTEVSSLPYEEKRILLGDNNPFHNFEYYIGGYYVDPALNINDRINKGDAQSSEYVKAYDWGKRHGKNWMTSVKDQGYCGACWAFASTGAIEAYLNIYYNKLFNINLSVQEIISCTNIGCNPVPSIYPTPTHAYNYIFNNGIMSNLDFMYQEQDVNCDLKPVHPSEHIYIDDFKKINLKYIQNKEDTLKHYVIQQPLTLGVAAWNHAVTLVGYKEIDSSVAIFYEIENGTDSIVFHNSAYNGKIGWLIKNSWGYNWGLYNRLGYGYIILSNEKFDHILFPTGEIVNTGISASNVLIEDRDMDGYYYWGCGEKPSYAPVGIPDIPDGDDNNAMFGPMDVKGHLTNIHPDSIPATVISYNRVIFTPTVINGDLIITEHSSLTVNSHLIMHPDAQIINRGGKIIIDGGVIINGHLLNKGSLVIKNGGTIKMRTDDEFIHNPESINILNTNLTPYPLNVEIENGGFVKY